MNHFIIGPETQRLEHRAFTVEDAEAFYALNGNAGVMRLTGEPVLRSVDAAREAIANYPDFDEVGYGRSGVRLERHTRDHRFLRFEALARTQLG